MSKKKKKNPSKQGNYFVVSFVCLCVRVRFCKEKEEKSRKVAKRRRAVTNLRKEEESQRPPPKKNKKKIETTNNPRPTLAKKDDCV